MRAACIVVALAAIVEAQAPTSSVATQPEFIQWAVTQGGLTLVVLLLVWSYRRDLIRIAAKDAEKVELLTALVRDATAAIQASTSQAEATEKSVHRLSRALEDGNRRIAHVIPGGRREYDDPPTRGDKS